MQRIKTYRFSKNESLVRLREECMSDFGYTYEGLRRWAGEQPRTFGELDFAFTEVTLKQMDRNTTNTMWIELNRCKDVLRVLLWIACQNESESEEEENGTSSDCEGDPQ